MSSRYTWKVRPVCDAKFRSSISEYGHVLAQCLWNRGCLTREGVEKFVSFSYEKNHDPFLFADMEKAVERIYNAIKNEETIFIFGDYDADGVNASAILYKTLRAIGARAIEVYLPHREREGYGLSNYAIDFMRARNAKLIITCDCGISTVEEVSYAKECGMDVIITDHHAAPEILPPAYAIIHPGLKDEPYPFKHLSGGGVAFKIAQALLRRSNMKESEYIAFEKWLLDHVAISTVADMVPLIGENRLLVYYGLKVLPKTKTLGLKHMYEIGGINTENINTHTIGYQIGPRINAAGRMDHSDIAFNALISDDNDTALAYVRELEQNNSKRKSITDIIFKEAIENIEKQSSDSLWAYAFNESWNLGVVGLVAGKIAQRYNKPTFIMGKNGDTIVGSGRNTVQRHDIMDFFYSNKNLFTRYGGHRMACGFSMEYKYYDEFITCANDYFTKNLTQADMIPVLDIDAEISLNDISWPVKKEIHMMCPFGMENPEPKFITRNVFVSDVRTLGADKKHILFKVSDASNTKQTVIAFDVAPSVTDEISHAQNMDIVYSIDENEWNGERSIRMRMLDYMIL